MCLDFINTVGGRIGEKALRDKLRNADDLERWAGLAGMRVRISPKLFSRAIVLREVLYRICKSSMKKRTPSEQDMAILNRELAAARSHEQLLYSARTFRIESEDAPEQMLWAIARSAVALLTSDHLAQLRQCGGAGCGWLFIDTSRNRSRQWCDMRICGNRAKARNFRQRLRKA